MRIRISLSVFSVLFVLCLGISPAVAKRGIPVPMIWGHGEKIVHRGELPAEVRGDVSWELGANLSVGFIYSRYHVFFIDFWTSNGRFVLYSGDRYLEIEDVGDAQQILAEELPERFDKPFLYVFPLGWLILGPPLVLGGGFWMFGQLRGKRMEMLFGDSRYTEALKLLFKDTGEKALGTEYDQASFRAAARALEAKGVPRAKAETNLHKMSQIVAAQRNHTIEHALVMASSAMEGGDLQRARNQLTKLLAALPESDPRHAPVTKALAGLMEEGGTEASPDAPPTEVS